MAETVLPVGSSSSVQRAKAPQDTSVKESSPTVKKSQRPNYNQIYSLPLPLLVHPLPPLIPHNPLSLLHIGYVYLRQVFSPPASYSKPKYTGFFSHETRSIHVIDERSARALWERGFFGKGSLSRSEPSWLEREKRRKGVLGESTSEEHTRQRREERKAFKLERARKEREAIEDTIKEEQDRIENRMSAQNVDAPSIVDKEGAMTSEKPIGPQGSAKSTLVPTSCAGSIMAQTPTKSAAEEIIINEEHLQLNLEEAFFLAMSLSALDIIDPTTQELVPVKNLLPLFMAHSTFPPTDLVPLAPILTDHPFLISYVAYHHFRSLGWVVRPGVKFAVDLLLYLRGPVFSHAEFAVIVLPAYSNTYWANKGKENQKPWHWLHMVNRVQSQVRKTLVLCYVEVPPQLEGETATNIDMKKLLGRYRVREFVLKRWTPNRNRD